MQILDQAFLCTTLTHKTFLQNMQNIYVIPSKCRKYRKFISVEFEINITNMGYFIHIRSIMYIYTQCTARCTNNLHIPLIQRGIMYPIFYFIENADEKFEKN